MKSKLSKFADDTMIGGKVDSRGGGDQIQEGIDTCIDWQKIGRCILASTSVRCWGWERTMKIEITGCKG